MSVILYVDKTYGSKPKIWSNISGATDKDYTLPAITKDNYDEYKGQSYYRVVATQKKGSNVKSVISRIATVTVGTADDNFDYHSVNAELTVEDHSKIYKDGNQIYTIPDTEGIVMKVNMTNASDENEPVPNDGELLLMRKNADGTEEWVGSGTMKDGIAIDSDLFSKAGLVELYVIYVGERDVEAQDGNLFYPASTEPVYFHVEKAYNQNHPAKGIFLRVGIPIRISIVEKLKEGNIDFDKIKASYKNGTLKDLWKIALQNEDGSLASWSGNLVVRIKVDDNLDLEKFKVLALKNGQSPEVISVTMDRDELVIVTDAPGNYAMAEEKESTKDSNVSTGDSEQKDDDKKTDKKEQETNQENKDKTNPDTGDDTPIALVVLCMVLSVFGIVTGLVFRKK